MNPDVSKLGLADPEKPDSLLIQEWGMGNSIEAFRNMHKGEPMIVCGLGDSVRDLPKDLPCRTIGVNDVWKFYKTDYILIHDKPFSFEDERRATIEKSNPLYWFITPACWYTWGKKLKPALHFDQAHIFGCKIATPSIAAGIAMMMGASRIGVIGVDLYNHPRLNTCVDVIDHAFADIIRAAYLTKGGIVNLSQESSLRILPKMSLDDFLSGAPINHAPDRAKAMGHGLKKWEHLPAGYSMTPKVGTFYLRYDRLLRLWFIRPEHGDGRITAANVQIDVPTESVGRELKMLGYLNCDHILSRGGNSAVINQATFTRPGCKCRVAPRDVRKSWNFMYDDEFERWMIWKLDTGGFEEIGSITTDAPMHSRDGTFSSVCEMHRPTEDLVHFQAGPPTPEWKPVPKEPDGD